MTRRHDAIRALLTTKRQQLEAQHPQLRAASRPRPAALPARVRANRLIVGRRAEGPPFAIDESERLQHMHVVGATGSGKSKFYQHGAWQDILNGRGVLVIDPHGSEPGSLYQSLLLRLHDSGLDRRRRVHLIDPNATSHVVGFNPLACPPNTDPSVIAGHMLEAVERGWGDEDSQQKPTMRRVLKAVFALLAEHGLTLAEAGLFFDPGDPHGLRAWAIEYTNGIFAREQLQRLDRLARDHKLRSVFDIEVVGPINRLAEFVAAPTMRAIVGQKDAVIDLQAAMDGGDIILCNLQGGQAVHEQDCDLLGRLLVRSVLFHSKRRQNRQPFFCWFDECQRYVSGDLPTLLAECRKTSVGQAPRPYRSRRP